MHNSVPHPMRKADQGVFNMPDIIAILNKCSVLHLGLTSPDGPYVVPLNFGYKEQDGVLTVFFHCAKAGRKADMLAADPRVCFEADCNHNLISADTPCEYSFNYESVIGFGKARLLGEPEDKSIGLSCIMARFSSAPSFDFDADVLSRTSIYAIDVEHITGKKN